MASRSRNKRRRRGEGRGRLGLWVALALVLLVAAYLAALDNARPHVTGDTLSLSSFNDLAQRGRIHDALILDFDSYVVGSYGRDDGTTATYNMPFVRMSNGALVQLLLQDGVPTSVDQQTGKSLTSLATYLLPTLILILLFAYVIVSYRRGTGLFGVRSGARRIEPDDTRVTFADVAGQDAAITELREVVEFLRAPERFAELGARIPKGILMYGPPGCGKTLMAKALAGEAGASFYSISGSDFVEVFVGVGAARVRDLFREAREHSPALIFVDEIDAVGRARGGADTPVSHGEQEQALNQILTEMDGFSTSDGIIVVGATNRPDILDSALLRPGRFDRSVGLERPDESGRLAVLEVHARGKKLDSGIDLSAIARRAIGLTGADLASVLNEGALLAGREHRPAVTQEDLVVALHRILEAPERQRRLSVRDRGIGTRFTGEERVTFADIAGMDDAIAELSEVKQYLASPEVFAQVGARVPRGILLSGPPGCGKTLLARAVAGEANAAFFSASGSEFVEIFVGQGAARVRDLFAQARAVPPAIVFLDEIDAVGGHRQTSGGGGHREVEQTLNQILVELDGFVASSGVIVMAATNRPDILDAALVRPGRFDRKVFIEPPNREGRRAILAIHARGKRFADDVDLGSVARQTSGFSGADLANALNEAALLTVRQGLDTIPMRLIDEAIDRTTLGVASKGLLLSEEERRLTAYHEAGHALVGRRLRGPGSVRKLSIIRRGHSLGQTWHDDDEERVTRSRSALIDELAMLLAGREAEQLVFGELGSGAANDLQRASKLARLMVTELGMSEAIGPAVYSGPASNHSAEIAHAIDTELRALLDEGTARARMVLVDGRPALDRIAEELLERETLDSTDLERLVLPSTVVLSVSRRQH